MILLLVLALGCHRAETPKAGIEIVHSPNPTDQHSSPNFSKNPAAYVWYYRTEVRNRSNKPLKIITFEALFWEGGRWVPRNKLNRKLTHADFRKWYRETDNSNDGWIQPGSKAICDVNWHGFDEPCIPITKWKFTAQDSEGNEYHGEASIESVPYPKSGVASISSLAGKSANPEPPVRLRTEFRNFERTPAGGGNAILTVRADHIIENVSPKFVVIKIVPDGVEWNWRIESPASKETDSDDIVPLCASQSSIRGPAGCCTSNFFRSLGPGQSVSISGDEHCAPIGATAVVYGVIINIQDDGHQYGFHGWTGDLTAETVRATISTNGIIHVERFANQEDH